MKAEFEIGELDADAFAAAIPALGALLHACVLDGASIGFVLPFSLAEAAAFWHDLVPSARAGGRRVLVARQGRLIVGTVQIVLDTPPNGRHRAAIVKLLVHPTARRQGIARALMLRAEAEARQAGRSLLVLDTREGDSSEALYRSLGFELTGVVPGYAQSIDGVPEACSFMHKVLGSHGGH